VQQQGMKAPTVGLPVKKLKQVLHVYHVLLDDSVIGAKEVERSVELGHEGEEQHCVSHCEGPSAHTLRPHTHARLTACQANP
jgi:hypothetical protein